MGKRVFPALFLLALLGACSSDNGGDAAPLDLNGTTWRLVELQSSDDAIGVVRPDDPAKYQMQLESNGRAALRLDCNRAAGQWRSPDAAAAQGEIRFTPVVMTRAMCPSGSLDTRIAQELDQVRTYMREGDTLRLILMADGGSQLWSRHVE